MDGVPAERVGGEGKNETSAHGHWNDGGKRRQKVVVVRGVAPGSDALTTAEAERRRVGEKDGRSKKKDGAGAGSKGAERLSLDPETGPSNPGIRTNRNP